VSDRSVEAVAALLRRHNIVADVRRAGHAGDIVVIEAAADRIAEIRGLSAQIRECGFRYVTVELMTSEEE